LAFPTVETADTTTGLQDTGTTTHPVTIPANNVSGNRLLLAMALNTASGPSAGLPAGWSVLVNALTNVLRWLYVAEKISDGTESDFSLTNASARSRYRCWRISGAHASTPAEVAQSATSSTNPNPPALNPTGWDIEDALWFAIEAHNNGNTLVTAGPGSYSGFLNENVSGTGGVGFSHAWRQNAVASEDPGTFTMGTARDHRVVTIGIRPAAAAAPTSAPPIRNAVMRNLTLR
jgi:hypothetical protein